MLDLFSPDKGTGNLDLLTSKSIWTIKIICLQEVHGKDEFLQAIQVLAPHFRLFDLFAFWTENSGGSAICIHRDFLLDDVIVTLVTAAITL